MTSPPRRFFVFVYKNDPAKLAKQGRDHLVGYAILEQPCINPDAGLCFERTSSKEKVMAWQGMGSWCSRCGAQVSGPFGQAAAGCNCTSPEARRAQEQQRGRAEERRFQEWRKRRDRDGYDRYRTGG